MRHRAPLAEIARIARSPFNLKVKLSETSTCVVQLLCYPCDRSNSPALNYFAGGSCEQVLPGGQNGIGMLALMAWWLGTKVLECEETTAADAPAAKTPRTKARTMVFMTLILLWKFEDCCRLCSTI